MDHVARDGTPKLIERCTLPLTGVAVVHRIITDLATIDVEPEGLVVREVAAGVEVADLRARTGTDLVIDDALLA